MQALNGFFQPVLHQHLGAAQRLVDRFVNHLLLAGRRLAEHEAHHLVLVARMADADAQAVEVRVIAELVLDVFQAVVAAVAAAELDFCHAGRQIQLVVRHQDLVGFDAVEIGHRQHRFAAQVHEGGRHQQAHVVARQIQTGGVAEELALFFQLLIVALCQQIDVPGAGVVACLGVFRARVGQADYQFNTAHWEIHYDQGNGKGLSLPVGAVNDKIRSLPSALVRKTNDSLAESFNLSANFQWRVKKCQ